MRITRTRHQRDFVILPNAALEDLRLSWKARGLLGYLLSRPDGWGTDSERLAEVGPDGRDSVRAGLRELEAAGYLVRTKVRDARGRISTTAAVQDTPRDVDDQADEQSASSQAAPGTDSPAPGQPAPDAPTPDAPHVGGPGGKYSRTDPKNPNPKQPRTKTPVVVRQDSGCAAPPAPASGGASPDGHQGQHLRCRACGTSTRAQAVAQGKQAAATERERLAAERAAQRQQLGEMPGAGSEAGRKALSDARAALKGRASAASKPAPARP